MVRRGAGGKTQARPAQEGRLKLYVDDLRTPPPGWRLARTVADALAILTAETFEEVSLDYMIGDGEGGNFLPVARFIAELPEAKRPRRVRLHTSSAAGADQMRALLQGKIREIE